jgi:elongation factor G
MAEEVAQYRQELIEAVADYDEKLLGFDDPNTITEEEVHEAIRKATIDISIIPMMCGSSFKNKVYKLGCYCADICLVHWILKL